MSLTELLLHQDGLILREQALASGLSANTLDRRLQRGDWVPVHPRVYRPADRALLPRMKLRAAAMWAGEGAVLIGSSALAWWRVVEEVPDVITLAVGPDGGHTAPAGVRLVRRAVPAGDTSRVDGLLVLHRAPAVLEAAVVRSTVDGARVVDRALQEGRVGIDGLRAALAGFGQRHGVVAARRLVALAAGDARSEAERLLVRELRSARIVGWVANLSVPVPGWGLAELDLAFVAARLVVEVDGWAFHRDVDRFRSDARRQSALVAAGWRVLRVTWYDLVADPARVVATIVAALRSAA